METKNTEIPIEIPLDFPYKTSDKLLQEKVEELAWGVVKTTHTNLTYKYSAIAQIGLIEMRNRSNAKNSKFAKRTTLFSLFFSIAAILCSFIAVYFAYKDDETDTVWQNNQLDSYNQMTIELKELNKKIDSLTIIMKTSTKVIKSEGK
ncbi:hypothetical protein [Flectobacillus longus]|uniref:hypothetical protein n=1 Tax=Flectobacillus longus TaxID=2984207 RepID=UPI0024B665AD|nr:hypothetical protein [Flectobacillus longus]MDI9882422.1 hypothetical protein [Flectobacillus longus]